MKIGLFLFCFLHSVHADQFEGIGYGRLLEYDFDTKVTRVLMRGLKFANGVALSDDENFILVAETYGFRIWRYW
jgi:sugar lactone lactonase YvrE